MSYPNALFSGISFCCFVGCIFSSPWSVEVWNIGVSMHAFWAGLSCLNGFINSIIWNNNADIVVPVWCDISSKLMIGAALGIPCASFCIIRRVYLISGLHTTAPGLTRHQRRREAIVDLCISLGLPVLVMILHYIVQDHRFSIFEDIGCWPSISNTWPAYILVFFPPVLFCGGSAVYSLLSGYQITRHLKVFQELLEDQSNLDATMYYRLLCIASTQVLFALPLSAIAVVYNVKTGIRPWISWDHTHAEFWRVNTVSSEVWQADITQRTSLTLARWTPVICAIVLFGFFGFSRAAMDNYRLVVRTAGKCCRIVSGGRLCGSSGTGVGVGAGGGSGIGIQSSLNRKRESGLEEIRFTRPSHAIIASSTMESLPISLMYDGYCCSHDLNSNLQLGSKTAKLDGGSLNPQRCSWSENFP